MSDPTSPAEDSASRLLREFENSPAQRLAREMADSPSVRLVREMTNSPTARLVREIAESPTAKLAREMANSPAAKLAQKLAESPTTRLAREMADYPSAKLARELAESPTAKLAREFVTADGVKPGLAHAISEAQKALIDFGKPYGGFTEAVRAIEEQSRSFQQSLVASLGGPVGNVARMNQWASTLGRIASADIGRLYPNLPTLASEVACLHESTVKALPRPPGMDQDRLSAMLGLSYGFNGSIEATRLKMSTFAGVTDMFGARSRSQDDAYRSLFGAWRTRPDLPESYWRDARVRRRMYDAAEVDPGLVGLNLGGAVEVVAESGLTSGARSETNAVAVISFGDVSMTIRSHGTRGDAYKVLERFEEELRAYITRKLSQKFGPDWFKHRAGAVGGHAKHVRKQALERGENAMPLIHYTELGHLSSIILGSNNWDEVFADIFINRAEFDHDMQKLIAMRRPTMHIRPIDGVRLVELICVVQRLSRQMEDDGAWKNAAVSEW